MKKFKVEIGEHKTFTYEVKAKTAEEAEEKVQNVIDRYFTGYETKSCELVDEWCDKTEIQEFTEEILDD